MYINQFTIKVKKQLKHLRLTSQEESTFPYLFTTEKVNTAIKDNKIGKAQGLDGMNLKLLLWKVGKSLTIELTAAYYN